MAKPAPPAALAELTGLQQGRAVVALRSAQGQEKIAEQGSAEFYFVVVCRDEQEMTEVKRRLGVSVQEQIVSGDAVQGALEM